MTVDETTTNSKVLRSIYLKVGQIDRLKELSKTTRIPQAEFVREGIDMVLKKYRDKQLNKKEEENENT